MRRCRSLRLILVATTFIAAILALAALTAAPAALADGDPASDVLVGSSYFNPSDSGIPADSPVMTQLEEKLAAARLSGFPIRVALIATPTDLGTASALWRQPGNYVRYLDYELSNLYAGQLLVVMPNGFGLHGPAIGPHKVTAAEWAVKAPTPGHGVSLAQSGVDAVSLLAQAAGYSLAAETVHGSAPVSHSPIAMPLTAWLALLVGALLIAWAWRASLRARPLGPVRRAQT